MAPGVALRFGRCHPSLVSGAPQSPVLLWSPGQAELPRGEADFPNFFFFWGFWGEHVPAFIVLISPISLPSPFLLFKALSVINLFGGLMPG